MLKTLNTGTKTMNYLEDLSDEEVAEILRIDEADAELDEAWSNFLKDLTADFR